MLKRNEKKKPKTIKYFVYLGNMVKEDRMSTLEIKRGIAMAKEGLSKKKKKFLCSKSLDLELRE